jgi:hypothetical protein
MQPPLAFDMTLQLRDLDVLKDAAIQQFDAAMSDIREREEDRLKPELVRLEGELRQIYRVVVLLQKNEANMEQVAEIWDKMVAICDTSARSRPALR